MREYNLAFWIISPAILLIIMLVIAPAMFPVPSEKLCQDYSDTPFSIHTPEEYWCEHNETGWHFNQTAFNESWQNGVFT